MENPFVFGEAVTGEHFIDREEDYLDREGDTYSVPDVFFREWLRRKIAR